MKCSECHRSDCSNPTIAGYAKRDVLPLVVFMVVSFLLVAGLVWL